MADGKKEARPRCPRHEIVLTPEGECLVCRRENMGAASGFFASISLTQLVVAGALAAGALVLGLVVLRGGSDDATPEGAGSIAAAAAPSPDDAPTAPSTADAGEERPSEVQLNLKAINAVKQARRDVEITLYVSDDCPQCDAARAYLDEKGLFFTERNVTAEPSALAERDQLNSAGTSPTLKVDQLVLKGWNATELENAVNQSAQKRLATPQP